MHAGIQCVYLKGKQRGYFIGRQSVCVFPWYLLEQLLFKLSPTWLCNVATERALAQNAAWILLDAVQYSVDHGPICKPKHCQLIIQQPDDKSRTNSPSFWPWKIIWSVHTLWPCDDLNAYIEKHLLDGLEHEQCFSPQYKLCSGQQQMTRNLLDRSGAWFIESSHNCLTALI